MINKEKYKEEIFDIACKGKTCAGVKLTNGVVRLQPCDKTIQCKNCIFYFGKGYCKDVFMKWLEKDAYDSEVVK